MLFIQSSLPTHGEEFLSVKYSKKAQLRTGLIWIQHKPELITPGRIKRFKKSGNADTPGPEAVPKKNLRGLLPYSAIGKLLFTTQYGQVSSCSAAFVGSGSTIATSAHCVMTSDGRWNDDFLFIRAYGTKEQDVYAIECAAVPGKWGEVVGDSMLDHDYAFLKTNRRSKVGSLGITSGRPPTELQVIGYSANLAEGRVMVTLEAKVTESLNRLSFDGNPFDKGNSGAPWLDTSTAYAMSSHYKGHEAGRLWGARLTGLTVPMVSYVNNGCGF